MADLGRGQLDLALLVALGRGPAHGYEMIRRISDDSGGELEFAEGTVYPALHRLERAGLLDSGWDDTSGRRRRVYTLTQQGREAAAAERTRWTSFARGMQLLLGGVPR